VTCHLAYAKVNLGLEILGKRPNGYHEVRTILQQVDLADCLEVSGAPELMIECDQLDLANETNLIMRAARTLLGATGCEAGAKIRLTKRIPIAAGLGGGSSDAATTLLALNELWRLGLTYEALAMIARQIGADVTFFLRGGTALASGIGDELESLPTPDLWLTIAVPSSRLVDKTRRLYTALIPADWSDGREVARIAAAIKHGEFSLSWLEERLSCGPHVCEETEIPPLSTERVRRGASFLPSGFARVAREIFPEIDGVAAAYERLGVKAALCGAGPSLIALHERRKDARRVQEGLAAQGIEAYAVRTLANSRG